MLRKGVYPYEYMEEWKKFSETLLLEKDDFYSNPSMENITDAHYMHAKRLSNDFEIKSQGEYHDFYLKSDTLLLIDVFKNFRKMCFEIYQADTTKFSLSSRVSMASSFKEY